MDTTMRVERLEIEGLLLITPDRHGDERGTLSEVFRADVLAAHGVDATFVQENHVATHSAGVLRGLHFQAPPRAQGKLVRCTRGAVLDVAVDVRAGSATFGRHAAVELSAEHGRQIWIPPGFAHGYVSLEAACEVVYKMTVYYDASVEQGIAWDDPGLGIDWRLGGRPPILSERDRRNRRLGEIVSPFRFGR
jgi:dTDP-4-dehydrorhamnose 3,5-epimerase